MGQPPSVVIVVRHGARLDAADKQWHVTSPTPYDPPLTHGGWNQSKALGARIASILQNRGKNDHISADGAAQKEATAGAQKRRYKFIIHTSPFLRCVQTSLAIGAGLAQNICHTQLHRSRSTMQLQPSGDRSVPGLTPHSSTSTVRLDLKRDAIPPARFREPIFNRSTLRVDAFLGEWLTPDYYESVSPPPGSTMMVAGAKAELLRREDYSDLITTVGANAESHNLGFPGGWQRPGLHGANRSSTLLRDPTSPDQDQLKRDRGSSLSAAGSSRHNRGYVLQTDPTTKYRTYQPPIPTYAISSSDPIPAGYVAHARDACISPDYQWDSMREPQYWGTGGEYGEEWSSMHKRFRAGLQKMITWYSNNDDTCNLVGKNATCHSEDEAVDDADVDLVLILVSHGAGCNALIGALTDQPVLLDVGMASLTMALRKSNLPSTPASSTTGAPSGSFLSSEYEMALLASTDHLRSPTSSTSASSRKFSVASASAFRERHLDPSLPSMPIALHSMGDSLGSIRRATSLAPTGPRSYLSSSSVRQNNFGLWSASSALVPRYSQEKDEDGSESDSNNSIMLKFGQDANSGSGNPVGQAAIASDNKKAVEDAEIEVVLEMDKDEKGEKTNDEIDDLRPLAGSGQGLWDSLKSGSVKRRWTVNERPAAVQ